MIQKDILVLIYFKSNLDKKGFGFFSFSFLMEKGGLALEIETKSIPIQEAERPF